MSNVTIYFDRFSGVIPTDLLSIIRALVYDGHFSFIDYNNALERFNFFSYEGENKPCPVPSSLSKKVTKLSGKAMSHWTHIRNFPLIVKNWMKDVDDPILELGLLLHEIIERLTAQEFLPFEIDIVEERVGLYLEKRKFMRELYPSCFPRPKPKHHYMR